MDLDAMGNANSQLRKAQSSEDLEKLENGQRDGLYGDLGNSDVEAVVNKSSSKLNISNGVTELDGNVHSNCSKNSAKSLNRQNSQMSEDDTATQPEPNPDVEIVGLDEGTNGSPLKEPVAKGKCYRKTTVTTRVTTTMTSFQYYENGKLAFASRPATTNREETPETVTEIHTCTDEAFRVAQMTGTKNGKPVVPEELPADDGSADDDKDELRATTAKKRSVRTIDSDDEDDTPLGRSTKSLPNRASVKPTITKDAKDTVGKKKYVLAKFTDNDFYPALCDPTKKSPKGTAYMEVEFLDTKQPEDVARASVFDVSDLNAVLAKHTDIKVLYKLEGEEYLPATFLEVIREEGKPPAYVVKTEDGEEKRIKLSEFAMNHDEVLRLLNDLKPIADKARNEKDGSVDDSATHNGKQESESESLKSNGKAGQRPSARSSTRIGRTESPSKPAPEKKPAPKPTTTKKPKPKTPTPELEDDEDVSTRVTEEDPTVKHRVGICEYHKGEKVFAKWEEDKRWYAGRVNGTRNSLFRIDWCENNQTNYVKSDEVIREKDILAKGTRINVIAEGKAYYDEVIFDAYLEDGNHLVTTKKGAVIPKNFNVMMIQAEEVKRWKKNQAIKESSSSKSAAVTSKSTTPTFVKKRGRSPSVEDVSEEKSSKRSSKARPDTAKESTPDNTPILADSAFIITSGADKDSTFEREYIVNKVTELGGCILNTFEELSNAAGKRYLVAPTACRTAKFLQCLAANIPCVSHKWILDLADKGGTKKIDIEKYRLPSGKSSQNNKLVAWAPRKSLLDNIRVGLYGGTTFRSTWIPAFRAGKADPVALEDKDVTDAVIGKLDCVIVEDLASEKLIDTCAKKNVKLVTVEWIIQTLIHGTKQSFDNWPYQVDNGNE